MTSDAAKSQVRTQGRDGVWLVSLDRPPVNAVNFELIAELERVVAAATVDRACRALVLTGTSSAFSAGLDLKEVPTYDAAKRAAMIRAVDRCVLQLYGLPKPTVAAINGHVFAAGFVLALACDARYAATGSYRLGITEVGAGIPFPAVPLLVLQHELDPSTARSLSLSGRVFGPGDPVAERFVDVFVAPDRLLDAAVAEAMAASARPGYAAVKHQLKAPVLERMRRIVDEDSDPLLRDWF